MKNINSTAFLLDIDNLCGAPQATSDQVIQVIEAFELLYQPGPRDQVYCAATAKAAFYVKKFRPGYDVKVGRGQDGSDLRLLAVADPTWLAEHFDHVVVGSGDGIFSSLVGNLTQLQVPVEVIGGRGAISNSFYQLTHSSANKNWVQIKQLNFAVAA